VARKKGKKRPPGRPRTSGLSRQEQLREASRRLREKRKQEGKQNLSVPLDAGLLEQFRRRAEEQGQTQEECLAGIIRGHLGDGEAREGQAAGAQERREVSVEADSTEEMSFLFWAFSQMKKQVPIEEFDRLRLEALSSIIKKKVLKKKDDRSHYVIWGVVMALIQESLEKRGIRLITSS